MAASPTVPAALGSLRRLLTQAYDLEEPGWLVEANGINNAFSSISTKLSTYIS